MRAICQDGHKRICRMRGKMKKRYGVTEVDVVLISLWDFEYELKRYIIFRYTRSQVDCLRDVGLR